MQIILYILAAAVTVIGLALAFNELVLLRRAERRDEQHSAEYRALIQRWQNQPHIILNRYEHPGLFEPIRYGDRSYAQINPEVRDWCKDMLANGFDCVLYHQPFADHRDMQYSLFFANEDDQFAFKMRWGGCVSTSSGSTPGFMGRATITYSSTRSQDRVTRSSVIG